jgi:hypothetical protein
MPKMRMVMYCEIADAGPDEPWLEKFVGSFGSFPPGAVITTNVDQEVSPDAENLACAATPARALTRSRWARHLQAVPQYNASERLA